MIHILNFTSIKTITFQLMHSCGQKKTTTIHSLTPSIAMISNHIKQKRIIKPHNKTNLINNPHTHHNKQKQKYQKNTEENYPTKDV